MVHEDLVIEKATGASEVDAICVLVQGLSEIEMLEFATRWV